MASTHVTTITTHKKKVVWNFYMRDHWDTTVAKVKYKKKDSGLNIPASVYLFNWNQ